MSKTDRRVKHTTERLQKALIELIGERRYDTITIQDIVDRANVGRTTFYLHYSHKDELFMVCHEAIVGGFHSLHSPSLEELLSPVAPPGMISAYEHLLEARAMLTPIFQSQDSALILQRISVKSAQQIETSLRTLFVGAESTIPLDVLASYLAGAQIALFQQWLEKRQPQTGKELAQVLHSLQRAAIRDALGLQDHG